VEPVCIAAKPEEVVRFTDFFQWAQVLGAEAVLQLLGSVEALAPDAVEASVFGAIDVSRGCAGLPEPIDGEPVARIAARSDEVIEGQVERVLQCVEALGVVLHQLVNGDATVLRGLDVLEAVVVGAGQKEDVPAPRPVVASESIGQDYL
jgi:hypothetical protein